MNQSEATQLVTVLNRAGLVPALEGQGAVWASALEDVPYSTAVVVAKRIVATRTSDQRWVTPGDIRAAVTAQRKVHLDGMASPQPPMSLDGDPVREIAWMRAYRRAYGDTGDADEAMRAACAALRVRPDAPAITTTRPLELPALHVGGCSCGCLARPVRAAEGAAHPTPTTHTTAAAGDRDTEES